MSNKDFKRVTGIGGLLIIGLLSFENTNEEGVFQQLPI